jgi:hypothetical protein
MRTPLSFKALPLRPLAALAVVALLVLTPACVYDDHRSFGATEKWIFSDINRVPKIIGVPFVSIGDSLISPFTAACDQWGSDPLYDPNHKYLSYAGSRVLARSHMGDGYKWGASIPAIIIETVWLIVTGPIDLVTVLVSDEDHHEEHDAGVH